MAKKKSYQPPESPLARVWRGTKPFRGPFFSLAGMALFVQGAMVRNDLVQGVGVACMLLGGWLIGVWYRQRQEAREAEKAILKKIEKKQARKAARAERSADDEI